MENKVEKLKLLNKKFNGHFTTALLYQHGFSKYDIKKLVEQGYLDRVSKGKYIHTQVMNDEFKLLQQNNSKMVFSNETALYFHDMTGRFPDEITVTTQCGYHLRNSSLKVYYVKSEVLFLGAVWMKNYFGNEVLVYDKERTICDIIKNKNRMELQVYVEGLRSYFLHSKPDLKKLAMYAKKLGISSKVMDVVTVYMEP